MKLERIEVVKGTMDSRLQEFKRIKHKIDL